MCWTPVYPIEFTSPPFLFQSLLKTFKNKSSRAMKKLLPVLFMLIGLDAQAQEKELFIVDAKRISSQAIPADVVESVKKDFPGNDVIDYYLLAAEKVNPEWAVTVDDHSAATDEIDHYTVMLKGKKGGYVYGLYDKEGNLEKMKLPAKDFALPSNIRSAATSGSYSGYEIKSDKFVKVVDRKTDKRYVEVVVAKGGDTKKL
jgi:hypothetical protein